MLTHDMLNSHVELQDFLSQHQNHQSAVAVDTEFVRESTYYPEFCLLQIATEHGIYLLDVLAVSQQDLQDFWAWLVEQPAIILHSASQDLEVLRLAGCPPLRQLFDTQIAAQLCGYAHQIGYGNLVQQITDVTLAKGMARFDWRTRPLPDKAQCYAADDVRHLHAIYDHLTNELDRLDRTSWVAEECLVLVEKDQHSLPIEQQWRKVKGIGRVDAATQAKAKAVTTWREQVALRTNRPRGWILKDADLLELCANDDWSHLPPKTRQRYDQDLQRCLTQAKPLKQEELVAAGRPLSPTQKEQFQMLSEQVKSIAHDLDLDSSLLANRKDLERLAKGKNVDRLASGWRAKVLSDIL